MSTPRPLSGCVIGISISETEELERLGFDRSEMNRCVVRLSESLLAAGARLAFGHDWRPGGVMEAVAALAVRYFNVRRDAEGRAPAGREPIVNRVAAPDIPFLLDAFGAETAAPHPMVRLLEGIVDARQTPAPDGTSRAQALSLMREELADLCHLRVCLGGKLSGFSGKMPGIFEEALGALRNHRPVFASGIFGGASRLIVQELSQGMVEFPLRFPVNELREQALEIRRLSARIPRGLDPAEDEALWRSSSIEQCVELILRGAIKLWAER